MPSDDTLKPTTPSDWGRSDNREVVGFIVTLPSGNVARMTRDTMFLTMIVEGRIPNPLGPVITDMMKQGGSGQAPTVEDLPAEALPALLGFIDDIAIRCMLEPKVEKPYLARDDSDEEKRKQDEWQPSEGAIAISQLTLDDRSYIFRVALGGATDLESFRAQQAAPMVPAQSSQNLPRATRRATQSKKSGSKPARKVVSK